MGFGSSKKIVLYDTLLNQMTDDQILAILGHELGHHKFNHLWKQLLLQLVCMGNFIWVFSQIMHSPHFFHSFGFEEMDVSIGLVLFSHLYSSVSSVMLMITNLFSRSNEFLCDDFALRNCPAKDLEEALIKIHLHNPATLMPDPLYHYSHPSLMERLERIQQLKKRKL